MTATATDVDLARAVALTDEIARTRTKVDQLIRQRDVEWKRLYANGVSQQAISKACRMTSDAVYQGIRRADGRPVTRTSG